MNGIDELQLKLMEEKLRKGELDPVKAYLNNLKYKSIPRRLILKIANLSRRVGFQRLAAKLLFPIVRPSKPVNPIASPEEQIEYAINIMRLGSVNEANRILTKFSPANYPETLLYRAFCLFNSWDYKSAGTLLEDYLKIPELTAYQKLIGTINLSSAYIVTQNYPSAWQHLNLALNQANPETHQLLIANIHQLLAEYYIGIKKPNKAEHHIGLSDSLISTSHYRYAIYNKLWLAVSHLLQDKRKKEGLILLKWVRQEAFQRRVYEVIRECDLYEGLYTENHYLLSQLYFGTPYKAYRNRILNLCKNKIDILHSFNWHLKDSPNNTTSQFDLTEGRDLVTGRKLKPGSISHRLLRALCSDLYRPLNNQSLFSRMYPDEHYNYNSSPFKIYNSVNRLRSWLEENNIPIEIINTGRNEFTARPSQGYSILLTADDEVITPLDFFIEKIRSHWRRKLFSANQAIHEFDFSLAKIKRLLKEGVGTGKIVRIGKGSSTRYQVKKAAG